MAGLMQSFVSWRGYYSKYACKILNSVKLYALFEQLNNRGDEQINHCGDEIATINVSQQMLINADVHVE